MVKEGDTVPRFNLPNQTGEKIEPNFEGLTVLYFYPRDGTPGCETEAVQFKKEFETYRDLRIDVYGISTDDPDSHKHFSEEHDLPFDLLSDSDGSVAGKLEVEINNDRAERTTFVIDGRTVYKRYDDVNPDGHPRDVLMDLLDAGKVSLE